MSKRIMFLFVAVLFVALAIMFGNMAFEEQDKYQRATWIVLFAVHLFASGTAIGKVIERKKRST